VAGNASPATQVTATASNTQAANFIVSPTNGQVLTTNVVKAQDMAGNVGTQSVTVTVKSFRP
jgi:hypothetical protein